MFTNIEKMKNNIREFQPENGQKFKNTQAELKKNWLLYKKSVMTTKENKRNDGRKMTNYCFQTTH